MPVSLPAIPDLLYSGDSESDDSEPYNVNPAIGSIMAQHAAALAAIDRDSNNAIRNIRMRLNGFNGDIQDLMRSLQLQNRGADRDDIDQSTATKPRSRQRRH